MVTNENSTNKITLGDLIDLKAIIKPVTKPLVIAVSKIEPKNTDIGGKMKSIGAMWMRKDKNEEDYFTMALKNESFVIFKNKNKKEANHPDYYVFLRGPEKRAVENKETKEVK